MGIIRAIDRLSGAAGRVAAWLGLAMVLIGGYAAIGGKLSEWLGRRLVSVAFDEAQWYLFSLVFLFAAPWALREGAHVRVDVLYGRYGARGRAWTNLIGGTLFLIPFTVWALLSTLPAAMESLSDREVSPDAGGLLRYPLMMAVPFAFFLLLLQGAAEVARAGLELRDARQGKSDEAHAAEPGTDGGAA